MSTQAMIQHPFTSFIAEYINSLEGSRLERNKGYLLINILAISICAIICSADDFMAIERFGSTKQNWFESFLKLPNGIPSCDTFNSIALTWFSLSDKRFRVLGRNLGSGSNGT